MSNFSNKRSSNITSFIALILGILLIVSVVLGCGTYFGGWFSKSEDSTTEDTTADGETNNLVVSETDTGSGISIMKSVISSSNELGATTYSGSVEIDGSTYSYESSYDITATIDDEATDRTVNWTLSCSSISDISSYVVLSSDTSESGESITVYCLQPFGYQITLTATSGSVSATCSLDYVARITGYFLYYYCLGVGYTVEGEYSAGEIVKELICGTSILYMEYITTDQNAGRLLSVGLEYKDSATLEDICIYKSDSYDTLLEFSYGTGSLKETISNATYTITLNSDIASSLNIATNTYKVSDWGINTDDIFNSMFGVTNAMSQSSYKSKVYNACQDYFNENGNCRIFTVTLSGTGDYMGDSYSIESSTITLDYDGYYVSATSVDLTETSIYF